MYVVNIEVKFLSTTSDCIFRPAMGDASQRGTGHSIGVSANAAPCISHEDLSCMAGNCHAKEPKLVRFMR